VVKSLSKTNEAWETLFKRHEILKSIKQNGFCEIKAKDIKVEREPRLMAKFDHYRNLPKIFKDYGLSILPISRSSYVIGEFNVYERVTYDKKLKPIRVELPSDITTIDPANLYSESSALHCAYVTGMIDKVLGEPSFQTISGRMSSKEFDFTIRTGNEKEHFLSIKNAQVEIDGGYEGREQFMIVEAKNETVEDFLVRQLYYPYRLWEGKISKENKPVFFTYSNDIFSFFIYEFTEPKRYNSIRLIEQRDFIIAHDIIEWKDLKKIYQEVQIETEPLIPFPQADNFTRIVDLLGLLVENDLSKQYLTTNYDFDERQTNYYTTAGIYLGLIKRYTDEQRIVKFSLTRKAKDIMSQKTREKYLLLAESIIAHEPFKMVLAEYLQSGSVPEKTKVIELMKSCNLYNINSESTYFRRASTVISWVNWILELPNTYNS
jgi:hypothetical protein